MRTNPDVSNYWCKEPYLAMEQIETAYLASPNNDSHRPFVLMYKDRKVGYLSFICFGCSGIYSLKLTGKG